MHILNNSLALRCCVRRSLVSQVEPFQSEAIYSEHLHAFKRDCDTVVTRVQDFAVLGDIRIDCTSRLPRLLRLVEDPVLIAVED